MTTKMLAPITQEGNLTRVSILGKESILVGHGISQTIFKELLPLAKCSTYVIVTDTNLASLHLDKLVKAWEETVSSLPSPPRLLTHVLPPGELTKCRSTKAEVEDFLFANSCTRDTCLLGLGGGVIGDLVGYIASTFMRGVPVVHIPTTLLSMVDSSIGGKTAIDVPAGKNLIGSFWQPLRVYVDLEFLTTLPPREFSNGMAEIIKSAAIADGEGFNQLEKDSELIMSTNSSQSDPTAHQALLAVVLSAIRFKAHVVTEDEREGGLRGLLNFGHSIGHAIEAILAPRLLHGECVALGMVQETEIARSLGACSQVVLARLTRVLKLYGLPTDLAEPALRQYVPETSLPINRLMEHLQLDKKNVGGQKRMVVLSGIGSTRALKAEAVDDAEFARAMASAVKINPATPRSQPVELFVPGSKSISNRALLIAALGKGECRISRLLHSVDTQVMLEALRLMAGIQYQWEDAGNVLVIKGCGSVDSFQSPSVPVYLSNAGTASRFLTSICALMPVPVTLTGNARMCQRPIGPLVDALRSNGASIQYQGGEGCFPLQFDGTSVLKGGEIKLAADVSSQYVSSILIAAPYTKEGVTLQLVGDHVVSQPYIDMTIAMMEQFGVTVQRTGQHRYTIPACTYINPPAYQVEGDASSATYPLAHAAITGTCCTVMNLGSDSLQGDAGFAISVLRAMGCEVDQTAMTTKVQGPPVGQLQCIPNIDMEPLTDAFLTASVLAAVASRIPAGADEGTPCVTNITGIANQRVKECDRIDAMVTQLAKLGVKAWELPDGIAVQGTPIDQLSPSSIHCYDDHRVAMSFSILATQVPGTIVTEKKCVEKTWPNWWDCLAHLLQTPLVGADLPESTPKQREPSSASVVIIGMRGAGKTTMGNHLSRHLNFEFCDLDLDFEKEVGVTVREFVQNNGWNEFRRREHQFLKDTLTSRISGTVISCGGGIVELEENRILLNSYIKKGGLVVHVRRNLDAIVKYLDQDPTRPAYANQEPLKDVWLRREPLYQECSNYEFLDAGDLTTAANRFSKLVKRALSHEQVELPSLDSRSYFVCLTAPDLTTIVSDLPKITSGCHAVELRVDLLNGGDSQGLQLDYIRNQIALLRGAVGSLPIIFTLRSQKEGGKFPNDTDPDTIVNLYRMGARLGCEILDVEMQLPSNLIDSIQKVRGHSKILASYHDLEGKLQWGGSACRELISRGQKMGDIVKLISSNGSSRSNLELQTYFEEYYQSPQCPLIAINMGASGQISRINNPFLTPVTHPLLAKAAPGQLTISEIHQALHLIGKLPARRFLLIGHPISQSPSPALHTALFKNVGLPHHLEACDVEDPSQLLEKISATDFGGACVTIPHKVNIMTHLDRLSPVCQTIGAVNTVVIAKDGKLEGHNTDWLGIFHTLQRALTTHNIPTARALILGAGGTSRAALYALHQLQFPSIAVYNRSSARIEELASQFSGIPFTSLVGDEALDNYLKSSPVTVVVDTLPGSAQVITPSFLTQALPPSTATSPRGVLVRLAYTSYSSDPLTTTSPSSSTSPDLIEITGKEILIEQALHQSQLWTHLTPDPQVATDAVNNFTPPRI